MNAPNKTIDTAFTFDVVITGGPLMMDARNATLSTFKQNFSEVPEPATLGLAGLALVAAGLARRRSQ